MFAITKNLFKKVTEKSLIAVISLLTFLLKGNPSELSLEFLFSGDISEYLHFREISRDLKEAYKSISYRVETS